MITPKKALAIAFAIPLIFRLLFSALLLTAQTEIDTVSIRYAITVSGLWMIVLAIRRTISFVSFIDRLNKSYVVDSSTTDNKEK